MGCSYFIDLVSFTFFDLAEDLVISIAFCDFIGEKYKLFQFLFLGFLIVLFQFDGQIQRISLKHLLILFLNFLLFIFKTFKNLMIKEPKYLVKFT